MAIPASKVLYKSISQTPRDSECPLQPSKGRVLAIKGLCESSILWIQRKLFSNSYFYRNDITIFTTSHLIILKLWSYTSAHHSTTTMSKQLDLHS